MRVRELAGVVVVVISMSSRLSSVYVLCPRVRSLRAYLLDSPNEIRRVLGEVGQGEKE